MAKLQSHASASVGLAIVYAVIGSALHIDGEHALLAGTLVVIGGIFPNIDKKGDLPSQQLIGLISALVPIAAIESISALRNGGVSRIALAAILLYAGTRFVVGRLIEQGTDHRGIIHSIPASIITAQLVFLIFADLLWFDRLYLAFGAFLGFFSHLLMDAYTNLDLVGKALGRAEKKPRVLKVLGRSWPSTIALYSIIAGLALIMARDLAPQLSLFAGIKY
jgi:membrane-bound metal-dependent hydrolase YbcI (DUF457 family)